MKKNMRIMKNILPFVIIGFLLNLIIIPCISAGQGSSNTVGIVLITKDGVDAVQVELDAETIENLKKAMGDLETWCKQHNPLGDMELQETEKEELRAHIVNIMNTLPENIIPVDIDELIELITPVEYKQPNPIEGAKDHGWINLRNSIISVGSVGCSVIPFYKYEAFARMVIPFFRTIRVLFLKGYTAYLRIIPPDVRFGYKNNIHFVSTRAFQGLYLNIGDFFVDRMFGPVVMLGRAQVSSFGS